MSEFDIIQTYFLPLALGRAEAADFANDTAILPAQQGCDYVMSTDTLHEGLHFFAETPPEVIAQKALRSNVSDIYASGADPVCYQLALSLPDDKAQNADWLQRFTGALLADQKPSGLYCSGGDTTGSCAGVSITVTMIGQVPCGSSVLRSGAQDGDALIVSGVMGKGAQAFAQGITVAPPLNNGLGQVVRKYAHAACDVSDGLIADLGHIVKASGVEAVCLLDDIPVVGDDVMTALTGGDDYEIVMAVSRDQVSACLQDLTTIGCNGAVIGSFAAGQGKVRLRDNQNNDIALPGKRGWQHF